MGITDLDLTLVKEARWLFWGHFWTLLKWVAFFEAAGRIANIGSSPQLNCQIKLSLSNSLIHTVDRFQKIGNLITNSHIMRPITLRNWMIRFLRRQNIHRRKKTTYNGCGWYAIIFKQVFVLNIFASFKDALSSLLFYPWQGYKMFSLSFSFMILRYV